MRPPTALQTSPDHHDQDQPDNNPALALRRSPWLRHPATRCAPRPRNHRAPLRGAGYRPLLRPHPSATPARAPPRGKAHREKRAGARTPPKFLLCGAGHERAARPRIAAGPLRSPRARPPAHPLTPLTPPLTHQQAEDEAGGCCGGHGGRRCAAVRGRGSRRRRWCCYRGERASECAVAEAAEVACLLGRLPLSPPVCQRSRPVGRVGPRAAAATLMTYFFIFFPPPFG